MNRILFPTTTTRVRTRRLLVVAIAILSIVLLSCQPTANGLGGKEYATRVRRGLDRGLDRVASTIPPAWKRDPTDGRPRACKAIERTLGIATRAVLLGGGGKGTLQGDSSGCDIAVHATSNRSALRGNLSKLSIAVRDSKSPLGLLEVDRLDVQ